MRRTTRIGSLLIALAALPASATVALASTADNPPEDLLPSVFDLAVVGSDESSVLVATRNGLYRAALDGGAERISDRRATFWSLGSSTRAPRRLFAIGELDGGGPGLLLSRDSGRTWDRLAAPRPGGPRLNSVDVSEIDGTILAAADDRVWRSQDGAKSWTALESPQDPVIEIAASTSDSATVYAATRGGLALSHDGGRTWRTRNRLTCGQPVTALDTGPGGAVYAFSLCRGLLRGDEKTGAWTVANRDFHECIIQHIAVDPTNAARVFVAIRCQKILVSPDYGRTWTELGSKHPWIARCATDATGRLPRSLQPDPETSAAARRARRDGARPRLAAVAAGAPET